MAQSSFSVDIVHCLEGYEFAEFAWKNSINSGSLAYRELCVNLTTSSCQSNNKALMPEWRIYRGSDLQVLSTGNQNIIQSFWLERVPKDDINRKYGINIINSKLEQDPAFLANSVNSFNFVDQPCYLLAGPAPTLWGHFLYEYLPRLLFAFHNKSQGYKALYISSLTPSYIAQPIKYLCEMHDIALNYFQSHAITHFSDVIIPGYCPCAGMTMHKGLNSLLADLIATLKRQLSKTHCSSLSRIFISRQHKLSYFSQVPNRHILNEHELARLAEKLDFSIVSMEDFDFFEKVILLDRVKSIVGGWGSGLINSVLADSVERVISIGLGTSFNPAFAESCSMRTQSYFEIPSFDEGGGEILYDFRGKPQTVNLEIFEAAISAILP